MLKRNPFIFPGELMLEWIHAAGQYFQPPQLSVQGKHFKEKWTMGGRLKMRNRSQRGRHFSCPNYSEALQYWQRPANRRVRLHASLQRGALFSLIFHSDDAEMQECKFASGVNLPINTNKAAVGARGNTGGTHIYHAAGPIRNSGKV